MAVTLASKPTSLADRVGGARRRGASVAGQLFEALSAAGRVVEVAAAPSQRTTPEQLLDHVDGVVEVVLGEIRARKDAGEPVPAPLYEAAIELQRCAGEYQRQHAEERIRILTSAGFEDALLGTDLDVTSVLERSAATACRVCDLDRAMIFLLRDGHLHATATYFTGQDDWAADCHAQAVQTPIDLSAGRLETEMIRRQLPALMTGTLDDPQAFKPIVHMIRTPSYVAVPIVVDGAVAGSLHLDAYSRGRDVDAVDRDAAAVFAQSIGRALERALAAEELAAQRAVLSELARRTDNRLRLLHRAPPSRPAAQDVPASPLPIPGQVKRPARAPATADALANLTRRETEILQLMSTGATNAQIANRFIVAEGTVKTHVKRILRKLNVTNRGQAVAVYAGLAGPR